MRCSMFLNMTAGLKIHGKSTPHCRVCDGLRPSFLISNAMGLQIGLHVVAQLNFSGATHASFKTFEVTYGAALGQGLLLLLGEASTHILRNSSPINL